MPAGVSTPAGNWSRPVWDTAMTLLNCRILPPSLPGLVQRPPDAASSVIWASRPLFPDPLCPVRAFILPGSGPSWQNRNVTGSRPGPGPAGRLNDSSSPYGVISPPLAPSSLYAGSVRVAGAPPAWALGFGNACCASGAAFPGATAPGPGASPSPGRRAVLTGTAFPICFVTSETVPANSYFVSSSSKPMARASSAFASIRNRMSSRYGTPSTKMILLGSVPSTAACASTDSAMARVTRGSSPFSPGSSACSACSVFSISSVSPVSRESMVGETRDPAPLLVTAGAGCPMSWVRGSCPGLSPKLGTTKGSAPGVTTWVSFLVVRVGAGLSTGLEYAPFPPVCPGLHQHGAGESQPRCVVGLLRGASRDGVLRSPPAPSSPASPC